MNYDGFLIAIDASTGNPSWMDTYPSSQYSQTYGITTGIDGWPVASDFFINQV